MAKVQIKGLVKEYKTGFRAVNCANIDIEDKQFVVLVGPSGCGKTTILRCIAGLEKVSKGEILIDNKLVNDIPPKDRNIAMVFQNYALYPHMTVFKNMEFALKIQKVQKSEIKSRVFETASILHIEDLLERKPKELSGGQQQRVAVGRAIVRKPKVFLFDEPLSNLDAKLRVQMRAEISGLQKRLQATVIYVTHDQIEAMTMADKIVVMNRGVIKQIGKPLELYNNPKNLFVASFIGSPPMNFIDVHIAHEKDAVFAKYGNSKIEISQNKYEKLQQYIGKDCILGIRPENLTYSEIGETKNSIKTEIKTIEPIGPEIHLYASTYKHLLTICVSPNYEFRIGDHAYFIPDMNKGIFFDKENEDVIA